MGTKNHARLKIMSCFTGVFAITAFMLASGYFQHPSVVFRSLFDSGYYFMLSPFLLMYLVMWLMIYWGDISGRVLLSKICGFLLVYLSYFFCFFYILVLRPGVGAPIGLGYVFLSMPWLIPVIYAIGYGAGSGLLMLREKLTRKKKIYPKAEIGQLEKDKNDE